MNGGWYILDYGVEIVLARKKKEQYTRYPKLVYYILCIYFCTPRNRFSWRTRFIYIAVPSNTNYQLQAARYLLSFTCASGIVKNNFAERSNMCPIVAAIEFALGRGTIVYCHTKMNGRSHCIINIRGIYCHNKTEDWTLSNVYPLIRIPHHYIIWYYATHTNHHHTYPPTIPIPYSQYNTILVLFCYVVELLYLPIFHITILW